jgi:hypothetical protein
LKVIEIPQPGTTEYEKMQGRGGETLLNFVLELARQFNALEEKLTPKREWDMNGDPGIGIGLPEESLLGPAFSSSVNPPEKPHARSTPEIQSHGEGLPRPEPRE